MIKVDDLWLFTVDEYNQLPEGFVLTSIFGNKHVKGIDTIDLDTRLGYTAYGVETLLDHPDAELFTKFMLQ